MKNTQAFSYNESSIKNIRRYNVGKFIKHPLCRHKHESIAQMMKLPYGSKILFVCDKCERARISIC